MGRKAVGVRDSNGRGRFSAKRKTDAVLRLLSRLRK